jgi:hypothetical protein
MSPSWRSQRASTAWSPHAQLADLGFGHAAIQRRTHNERLHRLHRGVYAVGHPGLTLRGRELAAVFACGPRAVLSHRSAGRLWGLLRTGSGGIEVTAPRSRQPRPGLTVHRSRCLTAEDRAVMEAIPVTSVARTLVDLAEVLTHQWLARAVHEAEVRKAFNLSAVEEALERVPGRQGRRRLLGVLAAYRPRGPRAREHRRAKVSRPLSETWAARAAAPADRGTPSRLLLAARSPRRGGRWSSVSSHAAGLSCRSRSRPCAGRARNQVLRVTWRDLDRGQGLADELDGALAARSGLAGHRPGPF